MTRDLMAFASFSAIIDDLWNNFLINSQHPTLTASNVRSYETSLIPSLHITELEAN